MSTHERLYTADEFLRIASQTDKKLELIDGVIVEMSPTEYHGLIAARIAARLLPFVEARKLGRVSVEVSHRSPVDDANVRLPDVSYISAEHGLDVVRRGPVMQMPDLAVEIQSPDDDKAAMRRKVAYYLANSSRMVWLVFPDDQTVEVHTPDADPRTVTDTVDGGTLLPGFSLPLRVVFEV